MPGADMDAALFAPLPSPEEMAAWDALSEAEYALPGLLLMENAGREAFQVLAEDHGLWPGLDVLVLAGMGNNGGDGLALARRLHNAGCLVKVISLRGPDRYRGIALEHCRAALAAGVDAAALASVEDGRGGKLPEQPAVIVDALAGAGFKGSVRGELLRLIRYINSRRGAYVLALDIPSGLNPMNGKAEPEAVMASATVCFAAPKPGLCLPWAAPHAGRLHVRDIGLPSRLLRSRPPARRLIRPRPGLLPPLSPFMHKGQKGRVIILGGSPGLMGAPLLSALGASRAGAGLVTIAAPAPCLREWSRDWPEVMSLPLQAASWPELAAGPGLQNLLARLRDLPEGSALVLGPGLGAEMQNAALIKAVLDLPGRPPLVLDADGLRPCRAAPPEALPPELVSLELLRPDDLLTPHPGEMLRLVSCPEGEKAGQVPTTRDMQGQAGREAALGMALAHTRAVVLLKGAGTLIARRGGPINLLPLAEPALAVGGSGDVLAGALAALMARPPWPGCGAEEAACLGAWLHGRAGRLCARRWPGGGVMAQDIAGAIPEALRELAAPQAELQKPPPASGTFL
ncbi:MAG: NAD(P)H-hydrate dehydratase [Deltaproteobacteria bacterium]|jgi:NAD(P)H-hydrate epimerase|nr:NAD(P)H-hydrate dehydratase [Deltaproteobacteria bacterium]